MRAPWLPLVVLTLVAAPPRAGWGEARPPERALPLPLPPPPTPAAPTPAAPTPAAPTPAAPTPAAPTPAAPTSAPPPFGPAPFGRPLVTAGAAQPGRWVAIYAAVAPASAHGISPVLGDMMMAHVRAETLCRSQPGGHTCRQVLELREGCGVLVQAVRDHRPVRVGMPAPESLARLPTALSLAVQGPDLASAEREAMARCHERERGLLCRVVASACTAPR